MKCIINIPEIMIRSVAGKLVYSLKQVYVLTIVLIVCMSMLFGCGGGIEPADPRGIVVWSDDCSEIACAINKADFDGRLFMNHETNEHYDIALYNDKGIKTRTIIADRTIDGFTATVEEIYYMKTKGYILIKSLMYNCGGRRWEKVSLDGKITQLHHISCDNALDQIKMLPSLNGTFIMMAYLSGSDVSTKNCVITFFDSTGTNVISKTETFTTAAIPTIRWITDSLLQISSNYQNQMKITGPLTAVKDSAGTHCDFPLTSSSAYCQGKGYISFVGSSGTISFSPTVPRYMDWCGVNDLPEDTIPPKRGP